FVPAQSGRQGTQRTVLGTLQPVCQLVGLPSPHEIGKLACELRCLSHRGTALLERTYKRLLLGRERRCFTLQPPSGLSRAWNPHRGSLWLLNDRLDLASAYGPTLHGAPRSAIALLLQCTGQEDCVLIWIISRESLSSPAEAVLP